jgi:hypothetical protein
MTTGINSGANPALVRTGRQHGASSNKLFLADYVRRYVGQLRARRES